MTVLTKISDLARKPDINDDPLVENEYGPDPENARRRKPPGYHVWVYRSKFCHSFLTCFSFCILSMVLTGAILGLVYYTAFREPVRYRGYCAIPIELPRDIVMQDARFQKPQVMSATEVPLRWENDPDVAIFTTLNKEASGDALNSLLERFDIDDHIERISIYNDGNNVEFIHDFDVNATGIVDKSRCFQMELDPDVVVQPGVFVFRIQRGEAFNIMRVRTELQAALPPAPHLLSTVSSLYAEKCADKPIYNLKKVGRSGSNGIRRKRSPEQPPYDYLHFAGKHLQEIAIDNLDELVEYEKKQTA
ncbi:hypothetical protein ABMA27_013646 [Loxostege sticticalis]|uniref:Integral membrane protein 2 n=1 Tax=Loxostege sticticalis TaxID=481309 RepID=A0ABR3IG26_LOXSC